MPITGDSIAFKFGSLSDYQSLTEKDPSTWYIITDSGNESIYVGTTLLAQNIDANLRSGTGASSVILKYNNPAIVNTASQTGAIAVGRGTTANKTSAFAAGQGTVADANYMTALGRFNKGEDANTLFAVGVGTGTDSGATTRKDGLKVNSDGSASYSEMGGSVAVNKFSCNTLFVASPSSLTVSFRITKPVGLSYGSGTSSTLLMSESTDTHLFTSFTINSLQLSGISAIYRTDSNVGQNNISIYVDGVLQSTQLSSDGDSFALSSLTSSSLVEFVN